MIKKTYIYLTLGLLLTQVSIARADYEDGVNAAFKGNFDLAFHEFTLAAEEGLDLAQYNLAILYFMGQGVDKDLAEAFKWTEAAAKQGHLAAQYNLGSLYFGGDGVARDVDQAVVWYSSAAKAGHPEAAFLLAKMNQEGEGIKVNTIQAHAWASMAMAQDHPEAPSILNDLEKSMDSGQISQARRLFARWQIE
ncbi:MAG: tetratricopeptide repeat protein [Pseudohongiellaceae bacterium]